MISDLVLEPFRKATAVLDSLGLRFTLFGGLAMNVWERIRATRDADFLLVGKEVQTGELIEAMREAGFSHHERANNIRLENVGILRFHHRAGDTGFSIKVDAILGRGRYYEVVVDRCVPKEAFGCRFPVASVEDCILLKLAAGRPIDMADATELASIHATALDRAHLTEWAAKLGCADALTEVLPGSASDAAPRSR